MLPVQRKSKVIIEGVRTDSGVVFVELEVQGWLLEKIRQSFKEVGEG